MSAIRTGSGCSASGTCLKIAIASAWLAIAACSHHGEIAPDGSQGDTGSADGALAGDGAGGDDASNACPGGFAGACQAVGQTPAMVTDLATAPGVAIEQLTNSVGGNYTTYYDNPAFSAGCARLAVAHPSLFTESALAPLRAQFGHWTDAALGALGFEIRLDAEPRTVFTTQGYTAFIAGALGSELLVYRVAPAEASLVAHLVAAEGLAAQERPGRQDDVWCSQRLAAGQDTPRTAPASTTRSSPIP